MEEKKETANGIKNSFNDFLKSYNPEEKERIWREKSDQFKSFWNNQIMDSRVTRLEDEKTDIIIRILDSKAKGHTRETESVAMVMIPQGVWRKMFQEIKGDKKMMELLNKIFLSSGAEIISFINELYIYNGDRKNSLTGKSSNAINAMIFAFNPKEYLSSVSLNDREKIINFFKIPNGPNFEADFPGKKVFQSNLVIIKWFKDFLGETVTPRTICDFLYGPLRMLWKSNIPDYQSIMLPLLDFAGDNQEHTIKEAIDYISEFFQLTERERKEMQPSGYDRIIDNRTGWSRFYLKKAGLLEDPRRGYFKITKRGLDVLDQNPAFINIQFLNQFQEFIEFKTPKEIEDTEAENEDESASPEDKLEEGYSILKESLTEDLLKKLRTNPPDFFERVVMELLVKIGYGKGEITGGSGDDGIDGIIYQDRLKIDKIGLQAKRYGKEHIVGVNAIKNFIASLEINRIDKGVFITTSDFTKEALDAVNRTNKKIILLDGKQLADLMIEYNLGVQRDKIYEIKKIDLDYF